jgi:beta-lactamase regulating signal transducer with metallopeptidase domain
MSEGSVLTWLPQAGGLALKSLIVLAVSGAALLALRRASASARHLVCLLTLAALLALPVLSLALPGWRLPVPFMAPLMAPPTASREATPLLRDKSLRTAPPAPARRAYPNNRDAAAGTTGREGVSDKKPFAAGALSSSSSRFGRTPASAANKEVGSLPRPFPWAVVVSALWLVGGLIASLRPLLGLWGIARLSQGSRPVSDAPTLTLASECASVLGLSGMPALRQADAPVPMTWGWRRPIVLLPMGAHIWLEDRLRAVLLHELAHIRRRDWLSHRFADVVCALYWFHPLVWLTARRLRAEGEIACDDLVLISGVAAPDYARHLLDVARTLRPAPAAVPQSTIAMARTARIEGRLKMILDTTRPRRALSRRALLLALTPGVVALGSLAMLRPVSKAQAAPVPVAATPAPLASQAAITPVPASHIIVSPAPPEARKAAKPLIAPVPVAPSPKLVPPSASVVQPKNVYAVPVRLVTPVGPVHVAANTEASAEKPPASQDGDVTVELAGVTDGNLPGNRWWTADGAALSNPVYTPGQKPEMHDFITRRMNGTVRNLIFAFRLPPTAKDVTTQWELPQSLDYSSGGTWITKTIGHDDLPEAKISGDRGGVRTVSALYPLSALKGSIRVGIASGPWTTAATQDVTNDWFGTTKTSATGTFIFSRITEVDGGRPAVTITTDQLKQDIRIVAVDAQGHDTLPSGVGGQSTTKLDQITAEFSLTTATNKIKQIRVETRPFRWVEFKDIALQPAP